MLTGVIIIASVIFSLPLCTDYVGDKSVKDDNGEMIEDPSPVPSGELVTTANARDVPPNLAVNAVELGRVDAEKL